MPSNRSLPNIDVSEVTLKPYYVIGIAATTIGIFVVAALNLSTPLASIQARIFGLEQALTWNVVFTLLLPKLVFVLGLTYVGVIHMIQQLLSPVSRCLVKYKKGQIPTEEQIIKARKRILNLHFLFVPLNVFVWILIPGFIGLASFFSGITDFRTAIILSVRASMVGLIASAGAAQRMEAISREKLIPFFFPDGRLAQLEGVAKLSISKRIMMVNRLGAVVPITILLVTLLTLQWEIESDPVSAVVYGRGIIRFSFVLFIYTLISSKQLNRALSQNITDPVNALVKVLRNVQKGRFTQRVKVISNDEIGYAGEVVNEMTVRLEEREKMQQSLNLAREIQQNLLPKELPNIPGFDIAGTSIYCDETGGDYYDYIFLEKDNQDQIRIVLGDVSGHGVSSALLMATTRALFRQRSAMQGDLSQVTSDVNRQLCCDVKDSGNFITLFAVELDARKKTLNWVRAGHDPAMLYDNKEDRFTQLKGSGIALGVDDAFEYMQNTVTDISKGNILVLYTDGVWEAKNASGDSFGKEMMKSIIQTNAHKSSQEILEQVMQALDLFLKEEKRQDDATLVIVKVR